MPEMERAQQGAESMTRDPRQLYDAVVEEMQATTATVSGSMFGMPCMKAGGKAFAGYYQEATVFKLADPHRAAALALPGAHLFDPMEQGRPMKEWVVVPAAAASHWPDLARQAFHYVAER
jgi:hypothetical protein